MSSIEAFFAFARERHAVYLRRRASLPAPWTTDPILQQYSFTNVFRQLDRTTQWYTEHVRDKVRPEEQLLAAVVFRWFNRIRTGEAIFSQLDIFGQGVESASAWDQFLQTSNIAYMRDAILAYCDSGPYVTGAYIVKTPDGYDKLSGVLQCIRWFMEQEHDIDSGKDYATVGYQQVSQTILDYPGEVSLESVWDWLRQFPYLGDFMAYEIVTDLRWSLLQHAPDIMTWANPGPGATRGLGRVFENNKDRWNQHRDKPHLIGLMQSLLEYSQDAGLWPQMLPQQYIDDGLGAWYTDNCDYDKRFQQQGDWPAWEMREVEHTLCEFDKYERARTGEGRPRGRFHGGRS